MTGHPLSFPCRFKQREDGSFFIRFPDLPEAMVDRVDEADLHRAAAACLASVLFWRVTNEIDVPMPSRLRPGQHMIELTGARALSRAIAEGRGRSWLNDADAAAPFEIAPSSFAAYGEADHERGNRPQRGGFGLETGNGTAAVTYRAAD